MDALLKGVDAHFPYGRPNNRFLFWGLLSRAVRGGAPMLRIKNSVTVSISKALSNPFTGPLDRNTSHQSNCKYFVRETVVGS